MSSADARLTRAIYITSIALASLATLASGMLVLQHLAGLRLPGCGPTSACAQLSASRWGSVLGLPVSYIGLAYFAAAIAALVSVGPRPLPKRLKAVLSVGAIASLVFLLVMAVEQRWCGYCVAVHASNLTLLALVMLPTGTDDATSRLRWGAPLTVGLGMLAVLGVASAAIKRELQSEQLAVTNDSIEKILANEQIASNLVGNASKTLDYGFAGRHPRGSDPAAARLVVFHDYQCKDCTALDGELEEMLEEYPQLAVSVRHYPMCSACNPHISWDFFHQEACRAAYLAEAAAISGVLETLWNVHRWLFANLGVFTDEEFVAFCRSQGWDAAELRRLAASDAVRRTVDADIAEAHSLGATGTPFVFLNGVEIRGAAHDPENVRLAVESLLASDPRPRPLGWDRRPPEATTRLVAEWQAAEPAPLPPREAARLVFGDVESNERVLAFLEPTDRDTLPLWRNLQQLVQEEAGVRLEVYLFPISRELNPKFASSKSEMFPRSAEVTRLLAAMPTLVPAESVAEAIGWLLETVDSSQGEALAAQAAAKFGKDEDVIAKAVADELTDRAIASDLAQAAAAKVSWAPTVIIGGRRAPSATVSYDVIKQVLGK